MDSTPRSAQGETLGVPWSDSEIARLRADTPGCHEVLHFNNAGASLPPRLVLETQVAHLRREALIGGYEAAEEAEARLAAVYQSLAQLLGAAGVDEIAIVENATRAFDMAFYAIAFGRGDVILTSSSEYASNYVAFLHMAQRGVRVEVVPSDSSGQLDIAALRERLDARVRLISIAHVPTNSGLVQPVEAVGALARAAGVFFLLDATQSVGQLPVDVKRIGCHALTGTSRKYLRGPRGVGFLWVDREWIQRLDPVILEGHAAEWVEPDRYVVRSDSKRFEVWETNVAGRLGLGAAVNYALAVDPDRIWPRVRDLAARLREQLEAIDGVTVRDGGVERGGIVTFTLRGCDAEQVKSTLRAKRINVTVLRERTTLLDMRRRGLRELVRASVHYYNTGEEVERLAAEIEALASSGSRLRRAH